MLVAPMWLSTDGAWEFGWPMAINKRIEGQHLRLAWLQLPLLPTSGATWLCPSGPRLIFACSPCGEAETTDRVRMKTRARVVKLSLYIVGGCCKWEEAGEETTKARTVRDCEGCGGCAGL